ncbi:hypothetical protein GO755_34810 [Spirosoma sp. HMF4905]|uniref:Uncharacterized protein n=1 Tax=Spirosoma arboris TaxID=2682092 RepID=A0A7K1SN72_9BACT|nr:hypothetical protein [Spirosoma arboris]MVM35245.1 hypothetical protein [Spirosoma arboris]
MNKPFTPPPPMAQNAAQSPSSLDSRRERSLLEIKSELVGLVDSYFEYESIIPALSDMLELWLKTYPYSLEKEHQPRELFGTLRLICFLSELRSTHDLFVQESKKEVSHAQ